MLGLALDESTDKDVVCPVDEFEFIIDRDLALKVGDVEIDFSSNGLYIKTEHDVFDTTEKSCSGCSCKS